MASEKQRVEPGVYENVPFADYCAMDAVNHSAIKQGIGRSMAHVWQYMNRPYTPPTDAMKLGTALHAWTLERARYSELVAVLPKFDARTTIGKQVRDGFYLENDGKTIITADDDLLVRSMSKAISAHPEARKLAAAKGRVEVVVVWDDAETGLRLKARCDKVIDSTRPRLCVDIKTTQDASLDEWERSIFKYGYHTQAALYEEAWASRGEAISFVFLVVESDAPHGVSVDRLDEPAMQVGRDLVRQAIRDIAECKKTGVWPGYPSGVRSVGLPAWVLKRWAEVSQ